MVREEYRLRTKKLQASKLSKQELMEWAESTVLLENKAAWNGNFSQLDSLIQAENGPWETHLEHLRVLHNSIAMPPPSGYVNEGDKAARIWSLFNGQLKQTMGQLGKAPVHHDSAQIAVTPPRATSWKSALVALLLASFFAGAILRRTRKDNRRNDPAQVILKNPLLIDLREKITKETPDPHQIIQIDYIEFKLGLSPIQRLSEKDKKWSRLNHSDLTLLHLIFRGHPMSTCAEFTGKTPGHVYNQRSKLRKTLGVPPDVKFSTFIEEAASRQ